MSTHTQLDHESREGERLRLTAHQTDSPILPIEQLKELATLYPDGIEWVLKQTQAEAEARRSYFHKTARHTFIERIAGQLIGGAVAILFLGGIIFLTLDGGRGGVHVAEILAGGTMVSVIAVLVRVKLPALKLPPFSRSSSSDEG